jgi:hypothetical protein
MKKFDIVKLVNLKEEYKSKNLYSGLHGIVVETGFDSSLVLFFNEINQGDFALLNIKNDDMVIEKEKLPSEYLNEIENKLKHKNVYKKDYLMPLTIKQYDLVELTVEDEKYARDGIHKGDKGCVMENIVMNKYILVDFSGIKPNGEFYGDCISVHIEDLKVID